jgi:hypothetical protein
VSNGFEPSAGRYLCGSRRSVEAIARTRFGRPKSGGWNETVAEAARVVARMLESFNTDGVDVIGDNVHIHNGGGLDGALAHGLRRGEM